MNIERDLFIYDFTIEEGEKYPYYADYLEKYNCYYCKNSLTFLYLEIIGKLREADLLPEDFKQTCCFCYLLEKVGLLDIYKHLKSWDYDADEDYLTLYINPRPRKPGECPHTDDPCEIRIWNYMEFYY